MTDTPDLTRPLAPNGGYTREQQTAARRRMEELRSRGVLPDDGTEEGNELHYLDTAMAITVWLQGKDD